MKNERQTLAAPSMLDFFYIIPKAGPFFRNDNLKVTLYPSGKELKEGVDFTCTHLFYAATQSIGSGIYGSLTFYDHTLTGTVALQYQSVGGDWTLSETEIVEVLANYLLDPRITMWEQVTDVPYQFPPIAHEHNIDDFYGAGDIVNELTGIREAIAASSGNALATHIADRENPHQVTKAQVGLSLVSNFPPATTQEATQGTSNTVYMTALRVAQAIEAQTRPYVDAFIARRDNPHSVTKAQVGLANVENLPLAIREEAELGASHVRYMTALRVKEAITYQIGTPFATFIARQDNPHQVTKAQVGLPLVENYAMATVTQARQGSLTTAYMSPSTTQEAIYDQVGRTLAEHINDTTSNPHQVTKVHVGLGSVQNFAVARQNDSEAGIRDDLYMTPLQTRYAIQVMADSAVGDHATRRDNPHQVNKAQVGLALVENFGIANEVEARTGTSSSLYMTPLGVAQAINENSLEFEEHLNDRNNPHGTTAAQVGAYNTAQIDQLLATKLNATAVAADSGRIFGFDRSEFENWMLGMTVGNANKVYNLTQPQLIAAVLAGRAADSTLFDGRTPDQFTNLVMSQVNQLAAPPPAARQLYMPPMIRVGRMVNGTRTVVAPAVNWIQIGAFRRQPAGDNYPTDIVLLLVGGKGTSAAAAKTTPMARAIITLSPYTTGSPAAVAIQSQTIESLNGEPVTYALFLAPGMNNEGELTWDIWMRNDSERGAITITELSRGLIEFDPVDLVKEETDLQTTAPSPITAFTPVAADVVVPVKEFVTVATGAVRNYDLQTLLGANHVLYDLDAAEVIVRVKDTQVDSPTLGAYISAEAVATYGILNSRTVRVANLFNASADLYVRIEVRKK